MWPNSSQPVPAPDSQDAHVLEIQASLIARSPKLKSLDELALLVAAAKEQHKTVVHCHGVFDLMHIGHIRHFQQAKAMGHMLVVTVTPDCFVNKGPNRPVFNQDLRAAAISALEAVDFVAINKWPMAIETIKLLRPDVFVKGAEFRDRSVDKTNAISMEEETIREVGGQLTFTDDAVVFSSSHLLNRYLSVLPRSLKDYLIDFAARYGLETVERCLAGAGQLKVLVIGEAIIDEYEYCETIGKGGKEPILVTRHINSERFIGGSLAIANQVAALSDEINVLTFLGDSTAGDALIEETLNPKIKRTFLPLGNVPTITKKRFVEVYPAQKLLEVDTLDMKQSFSAHSEILCARIRELLPVHDLVIVADYGHGMLGQDSVRTLCESSSFLAVTTQMNADNHGFHTISKYPRADYICISENELRLEARNRSGDLRDIIRVLSDEMSCSRVLITQGERGCLCFSGNEGFCEVPAFTDRVVDRTGVADSIFAVTALCAAQDAPIEILGFVANAVGAQAISIVGNRSPVTRVPLLRQIESLLK